MADSDIEINLDLIDNASSELAEASSSMSSSLDQVCEASDRLATSQEDLEAEQEKVAAVSEKNAGSLKDFALGASGAATAGFSLYSSFDRIEKSELAVDRANLQVRTSTKGVEDAQRNLNEAVVEHGANSAQAKAASEQLSIAQDRLEVANERAKQSQDNVNQAMMASAIQIIPSAITMVDSLSRAWKNFPDMTGVLKTLGSNVSDVGSKATLAAIGVGSFVGGFTLGYAAIKQFGDALGPVGRALMVVVPSIIAAAAAVWMLQEGITLGVATVALVAAGVAVGAMVANLESYGNVAGLASGGVVDHPMLALIGEGGEKEIVMPLSQYESQRASDQKVPQNGSASQPQPNVTYVTLTQQFYGDINSPEYVDMAAEKTINKLDEKLRHSRSG
jgi:hypothetical protein